MELHEFGYGLMCWRCRGFYWRLRPVASEWLCNYCAFKSRPR